MSFPASLTTRIVKGRFVTYPDGTAAQGTVRFVLMDFLQGPADDMFVVPFDRTINLDEFGAFSIVLPATDDPDWTSSRYKIVVTTFAPSRCVGRDTTDRLDNKVLRAMIQVPYNNTGPLDLADIINLPAPTPGESYIILSSKGVPGGVATLDEDGFITSSQLPPNAGVVVTWDDVEDKPATFPHDPITFAEVTGKPTVYPADPTDWDDVTNKPDTFPSLAPAFSDITGKPSTYPHDDITWTEITGKPDTFPSLAPAFSDVTGKPDSYPSSWGDIADIPDLATQAEMEAGDAAVLYTASLAYDLASAAAPASSTTAALATKAPLASPTFTGTVSGISAAMVGLGNVNNTTDANKPISAATALALAGFISPADHNYAGWTFNPDMAQAATLLATAGLSYIVRIRVLTATVSAITMHITTPGAGLANCFATLHNDAGAILGAGAVTADQSTNWQSGGIKLMNLSTAQSVTPGNWYKVRFWVGTATTRPTFSRFCNSAGELINAGLVTPNFRYATADSGMSTLALAPGTIGTPTSNLTAWWMALTP